MNCLEVSPGEPLTYWEKKGLELVALLQPRDVVLAIDVTKSVGFNEEGRIRLRQIVKEALKSGDSVYFVPFASTTPSLSQQKPIKFRGKEDQIDSIVNEILDTTNSNVTHTDIQLAELEIYRGLAQLNQCRLEENKPIKPQSVFWITDAPLFTDKGITPQVWPEMLGLSSPFENPKSRESQNREKWIEKLKSLPFEEQTQEIPTYNQETYPITLVKIPPTLQKFCNLTPGGQQRCPVNSYLIGQLWIPVLVFTLAVLAVSISGLAWISHQCKLKSPWKLSIETSSEDTQETEPLLLRNRNRIAIGGFDPNCYQSVPTPGNRVRAYLERRGNRLYLVPTYEAPILCDGNPVENQVEIQKQDIELNCPDSNNRDFYLRINLKR